MIAEFFNTYFCESITQYQGYNPVNTIVYIAILLFVSFFIIYPFFHKKGIKFDFSFFKNVFPYILLGSTVRIFEDMHLLERSCNPLELGFYTISPGIYIAVGLFAIFSLIVSMKLGKRYGIDRLRFFGVFGYLVALPITFFHLLQLRNPIEFFFVYFLVFFIVVILYYVFRHFDLELFKDKLNIAALAGQALDGAATFTALAFFPRFSEQHVVSNFLIEGVNSLTNTTFFGPFAFMMVKVSLVLFIIYFLGQEVKNKNLCNFIKIFIIILGFAPGIRDSFSLGVL
ncbi:MAG: DUF63 family protein [archaeon]